MTKLQANAMPITDIEPPENNKFKVVGDREQKDDQIEKARKILDSGMIKPNDDFDLDTLPEAISNYIKTCKGNTLSSNALFLGGFLGMLSGFMKHKRYIPKFQPGLPGCEDGYFNTLFPNLWMLIIAPSGTGKTSAFNRVLETGRNFFDVREYKKLQEQLKEATDSEKEEIQIELSSMADRRFEIPQPGSGQALLQSQSKGFKGTLIYNEYAELASLITRKEDNLKPVMTNLYDCQAISRMTITHGIELLPDPYLSILATSTLKWITNYVDQDDIESGYFARWLIFYPAQEVKKPDALPSLKSSFYDRESIKHIEQAIEAIIKEKDHKPVKMTDEAKRIFIDYHGQLWDWLITSYQGEQLGLMRSWVMRWYPTILKIAMILQYAKDHKGVEIDHECMKSAIYIMEYGKQSATFLFQNELGATEQQKNQNKVLEWIARYIIKNGKNPERHKLLASRQLKGKDEYEQALQGLEDLNILDEHERKKNAELRLK